ncbi:sulfite exporter TauE/SafE family protein [Magnetospirillum sp. UT-4]|uniref:sulfite exporter TauE/SafE family protein n=1 Tax=Magnetospirillum sp. UT-4 TaxID=2681467 RepID=UPI0013805A80|nr:sulfite exporter TauE/SafE family protein [Magnetospirillum sp. UT-4]CAA7617245.1 conserved membrane hypothetical protein [Magnetospirillum sp. UT-4]
MSDPFALLAAGASVCRVAVAENGGLIGSLALTGLIGSATHCVGMCGPFVLSQAAARLEAVPLARMSEWTRVSGAVLLPYHVGRATTYGALGALGAAAAGAVGDLAALRPLAAVLLGLAALLLVAMAVPRLRGGAAGETWWSRTVSGWARPLFAAPFGLKGWLLGVMLGFIPCGLLYAALAAAAASGDPVAGALGMLAFAAGTVPALLAVGIAGQAAAARWRAPMLRWAPLLLVANAGMLGFMAWQMAA